MLNDAITGHLILMMGPTGSGKGSISAHIKASFPEVYFSVSCTTRAPRPGEVHGREYYFIDREEFIRRVEASEFLEWAEFGGNYYGTLKSEVVERLVDGQVVWNEIELQGIEALKQIISADHRTVIYVEAGDWDTMVARAVQRAPIPPEELEKRHLRYLEEVKAKPYADIVVENHDGQLETAQQQTAEVVGQIITKVKQLHR